MRYFKKIAGVAVIVMVGLMNPMQSNAQGPDPCTDPSVPCPIDGGISLLIAAGIGVAAKKAYNDKKQKKADL